MKSAEATARIVELESQLNKMKIEARAKKAPQQSVLVTENIIGARVQATGSFKDMAEGIRLLHPKVSKPFSAAQWTLFWQYLGIAEDAYNKAWFQQAADKECTARLNEEGAEREGSYATSSLPTNFSRDEETGSFGPEATVQLAIGWVIRALERAGLISLHWRDMSLSGLLNPHHKPDYAAFQQRVERWASLVRLPTLSML